MKIHKESILKYFLYVLKVISTEQSSLNVQNTTTMKSYELSQKQQENGFKEDSEICKSRKCTTKNNKFVRCICDQLNTKESGNTCEFPFAEQNQQRQYYVDPNATRTNQNSLVNDEGNIHEHKDFQEFLKNPMHNNFAEGFVTDPTKISKNEDGSYSEVAYGFQAQTSMNSASFDKFNGYKTSENQYSSQYWNPNDSNYSQMRSNHHDSCDSSYNNGQTENSDRGNRDFLYAGFDSQSKRSSVRYMEIQKFDPNIRGITPNARADIRTPVPVSVYQGFSIPCKVPLVDGMGADSISLSDKNRFIDNYQTRVIQHTHENPCHSFEAQRPFLDQIENENLMNEETKESYESGSRNFQTTDEYQAFNNSRKGTLYNCQSNKPLPLNGWHNGSLDATTQQIDNHLTYSQSPNENQGSWNFSSGNMNNLDPNNPQSSNHGQNDNFHVDAGQIYPSSLNSQPINGIRGDVSFSNVGNNGFDANYSTSSNYCQNKSFYSKRRQIHETSFGSQSPIEMQGSMNYNRSMNSSSMNSHEFVNGEQAVHLSGNDNGNGNGIHPEVAQYQLPDEIQGVGNHPNGSMNSLDRNDLLTSNQARNHSFVGNTRIHHTSTPSQFYNQMQDSGNYSSDSVNGLEPNNYQSSNEGQAVNFYSNGTEIHPELNETKVFNRINDSGIHLNNSTVYYPEPNSLQSVNTGLNDTFLPVETKMDSESILIQAPNMTGYCENFSNYSLRYDNSSDRDLVSGNSFEIKNHRVPRSAFVPYQIHPDVSSNCLQNSFSTQESNLNLACESIGNQLPNTNPADRFEHHCHSGNQHLRNYSLTKELDSKSCSSQQTNYHRYYYSIGNNITDIDGGVCNGANEQKFKNIETRNFEHIGGDLDQTYGHEPLDMSRNDRFFEPRYNEPQPVSQLLEAENQISNHFFNQESENFLTSSKSSLIDEASNSGHQKKIEGLHAGPVISSVYVEKNNPLLSIDSHSSHDSDIDVGTNETYFS